MKTLPIAPPPGTPVSSSLIRELISAIRARTILNGPGYRTRETPNGTSLEIERTANRTTSKKTHGRFEVSLTKEETPREDHANVPPEGDEGSEDEQTQTYIATFSNLYYDIGGKTYEMPGDEGADPPSVKLEQIKDGAIIALKVPANGTSEDGPTAELVPYEDLVALQSAQADLTYYIFPLYKIDGGAVVCDFRTGPVLAMGEF